MSTSVERTAPAGTETISALAGEVVYFDGRYVLKSQVMVSPEDRGFLLVAHAAESTDPVGYCFCVLVGTGPTFELGEPRGEVESLAGLPSV